MWIVLQGNFSGRRIVGSDSGKVALQILHLQNPKWCEIVTSQGCNSLNWSPVLFTPPHIVCAASLVLMLQLPSLLPHILNRQACDSTDSKSEKSMPRRPGRYKILLHQVQDYCTSAKAQLSSVDLPMYIYSAIKLHQCGRPGNIRRATVHLVQYLTPKKWPETGAWVNVLKTEHINNDSSECTLSLPLLHDLEGPPDLENAVRPYLIATTKVNNLSCYLW